ncbi:MAG TPA: thioredoxin, partial [Firmicutes bacterium]|nr:thioredoxin [Bacillota bacterium]
DGIEYFQNDNGQFVHVLNFPDLSVRDAHRTTYYDGEAAFALMRAYALDKQPKMLQIVEKAFSHFIANKYWRHNDHWLSYCSYELFLHKPEREYLGFNLKNAQGILDFCLSRETTFATLLELLMATRKLIDYCKEKSMFVDQISEFDEEKLDAAINYRLEQQLNGLLFPEVAMYFKVPKHILWGFFIRHHSFRVRIDDIEHNLSGYCSYYQHKRREEPVQ